MYDSIAKEKWWGTKFLEICAIEGPDAYEANAF